MGERVVIGLRYCGGCNPRYDRVALAKEMAACFPQAELAAAQPETPYPAVLVVCGCPVRCADTAGLSAPPQGLIYLCGPEDLPAAKKRLARAVAEAAGEGETACAPMADPGEHQRKKS